LAGGAAAGAGWGQLELLCWLLQPSSLISAEQVVSIGQQDAYDNFPKYIVVFANMSNISGSMDMSVTDSVSGKLFS